MDEVITFDVTAEDIAMGGPATRWASPDHKCAVELAAARAGHDVDVCHEFMDVYTEDSRNPTRYLFTPETTNHIQALDAGREVMPWTITAQRKEATHGRI